jgi:hypothetical protein
MRFCLNVYRCKIRNEMMIEATNFRCSYMHVSVKIIPMTKGQLTQKLGA